MILAAGFGTRLWPLTEDRTKPALPVMGRPLIGYVAEYLAGFGIREVIVNLHHRADSVKRALGDGSRFGVELSYIEEKEILGTSGALDNARTFLETGTFFAVNGKIVTDIDLNKALKQHRETNAIATLVLLENRKRERFSEVIVNEGRVTKFGGMPDPNASDNENSPPLMFTGIQILEPRIFDYIPRGVFSHTTTDVYPQAIAAGETVGAFVGTGMWKELSTIERYLDVNLELLKPSGKTFIAGAGCQIAGDTRIENSVLWDRVTVNSGAELSRCVIADGVVIPGGTRLDNCAVVRAELVTGREPPAKALKGSVHGTNFVVPLTQ
jgi:NDP-sugar pyrophosphorylase family protein